MLDAYGLLFSEDGVVLGWWCGRLEVAEPGWYVLGVGVGVGLFQRFKAGEVLGCEMLPEGGWGGEGCVWDLLLLVCHGW